MKKSEGKLEDLKSDIVSRPNLEEKDIIKLLKADHEPLKKLIKIMKDSKRTLSERRQAFAEFGPLLMIHAKAEERILYTYLKNEVDMEEEAFEGEVEHSLAQQMIDDVKQVVNDKELWSALWAAKVKVLAELVEHHLKEEEEKVFPEFRKNSDAEDREELASQYIQEKIRVQAGQVKTKPSQSIIDTHH